MIVKNEAKVIRCCLESVKPFIDSWVIVDTGSTDGTQGIIQETLAGIPGQIFERPWVNFGENRTEAARLAEGPHHLLVIDADDVLHCVKGDELSKLTQDAYELRVIDSNTSYRRLHLFRGDMGFRYEGALHEVLITPAGCSVGRLDHVEYHRLGGGGRSEDRRKFLNDVDVLQTELQKDPTNARNQFYLAQSYRDAGLPASALKHYQRRVEMGGWDEEVYFSLHEIARMTALLGESPVDAYLRAYEFRPTRAEPLCNLAAWLRENGRPKAAYPFVMEALCIDKPKDILFVDDSAYWWRSLDEAAIASYWVRQFDKSISLNKILLHGITLPEEQRERVLKNLQFCIDAARTS